MKPLCLFDQLGATVLTAGHSCHNMTFQTLSRQKEGLNSYLFRLQTEGTCHALVDNGLNLVEPGELLLFKPGDRYQIKVERSSKKLDKDVVSSTDYYLSCNGPWIDEWWNRSKKPQKIKIGFFEGLIPIWKKIVLEKRKIEVENKELSDYLLRVLCLEIDRAIKEAQEVHNGSSRSESNIAHLMKNFIEEHAVVSFQLSYWRKPIIGE